MIMDWSTFFILYALSIPLFFLIDLVWLGLVARDFYRKRIGHLMEINWPAALLFYAVFLVGLSYFAIYPGVSLAWYEAFGIGALFGFFTYATYDLTNLATLRDWPVSLVVVDMLWGTMLGGLVTLGTVSVYTQLIV